MVSRMRSGNDSVIRAHYGQPASPLNGEAVSYGIRCAVRRAEESVLWGFRGGGKEEKWNEVVGRHFFLSFFSYFSFFGGYVYIQMNG